MHACDVCGLGGHRNHWMFAARAHHLGAVYRSLTERLAGQRAPSILLPSTGIPGVHHHTCFSYVCSGGPNSGHGDRVASTLLGHLPIPLDFWGVFGGHQVLNIRLVHANYRL